MKEVLHHSRHARKPLDLQGQQSRRDRERFVRAEALAFARWAGRQGLPRCRAAARLDLRAGTLGRWGRAWDADRLKLHFLGRPRSRGDPLQRLEVAQHLHELGPTVGLPALRCRFPELARSQLADLQRDCRCRWFQNHQVFAETLEWIVPGTVWAMDFSQAPVPIDGELRHVLAVRDLPSHMQISLLAAQHGDALTAVGALEHLFVIHGPPLLAKADNGSPFISLDMEKLLARWEVTLLLSPPRWPQYNGSVEAGFGSAKTRIHIEAARHGRLDHWLLDDVEAARLLANCASRPWGVTGPTPQERWDRRSPITPQQRQDFHQAVAQNEKNIRLELGYRPDEELKPKAQATLVRESISRALQGLGYLCVTRRRVTPPFKLSFRAIIP
jgi:transposase InsO family protein